MCPHAQPQRTLLAKPWSPKLALQPAGRATRAPSPGSCIEFAVSCRDPDQMCRLRGRPKEDQGIATTRVTFTWFAVPIALLCFY
jgi:hypothetical protein